MYAAIFSNVAQLIAKLDAAGSRYSEELDSLTEFSPFYRLPRALGNKLRAYNSFRFEVNRGFDIDEITSTLPPSLKSEVFFMAIGFYLGLRSSNPRLYRTNPYPPSPYQVFFVVHEHLLRQVPMFEECDDIFIKALVQQLKPQVWAAQGRPLTLSNPIRNRYRSRNADPNPITLTPNS